MKWVRVIQDLNTRFRVGKQRAVASVENRGFSKLKGRKRGVVYVRFIPGAQRVRRVSTQSTV